MKPVTAVKNLASDTEIAIVCTVSEWQKLCELVQGHPDIISGANLRNTHEELKELRILHHRIGEVQKAIAKVSEVQTAQGKR